MSTQLVEYSHLFEESEENSWLDRIDKRYAWVKRHLLNFEERMGRLFPANWEMSERIAIEFCNITRFFLLLSYTSHNQVFLFNNLFPPMNQSRVGSFNG